MTFQGNQDEGLDILKNPPQRKTTLKWCRDGELSAIDMARILDRLQNQELTKCDISEE